MRKQGWSWFVVVLVAAVVGVVAFKAQRSGVRAQVEHLERIPLMITAWDPTSCEQVAVREGVVIARLDMQGATIFRTGPVPKVDAADAQLQPWPARDEVRAALAGNRTFGRYSPPDGSVQILSLAQPRPAGGALYVLAAARTFRIPTPVPVQIVIVTIAVVSVVVALVRSRRRQDTPP